MRVSDLEAVGGALHLLATQLPGVRISYNATPCPATTFVGLLTSPTLLGALCTPFVTADELKAAASVGADGDEAKGDDEAAMPSTVRGGVGADTTWSFAFQARLQPRPHYALDQAVLDELKTLPPWQVLLRARRPKSKAARQEFSVFNRVSCQRGTHLGIIWRLLRDIVHDGLLSERDQESIDPEETMQMLEKHMELSLCCSAPEPRFKTNRKANVTSFIDRFQLEIVNGAALPGGDFHRCFGDLAEATTLVAKLRKLAEEDRQERHNENHAEINQGFSQQELLSGKVKHFVRSQEEMTTLCIVEGESATAGLEQFRDSLPTREQAIAAAEHIIECPSVLFFGCGRALRDEAAAYLDYDPLQGVNGPDRFHFSHDETGTPRLHATTAMAQKILTNAAAFDKATDGNDQSARRASTNPLQHPDPMMFREQMAIFAVTGKVRNTFNDKKPETSKDAKDLNNRLEVLRRLAGLSYGDTSSSTSMTLGSIVIVTDGDDDGAHIASLIVLFFAHHWPWLLHRKVLAQLRMPVAIDAAGHHNFFDVNDHQQALAAAEAAGDGHLQAALSNVKYIKGLGGYTAEHMKYFANHLQRFLLVLITSDVGCLKQLLAYNFKPSSKNAVYCCKLNTATMKTVGMANQDDDAYSLMCIQQRQEVELNVWRTMAVAASGAGAGAGAGSGSGSGSASSASSGDDVFYKQLEKAAMERAKALSLKDMHEAAMDHVRAVNDVRRQVDTSYHLWDKACAGDVVEAMSKTYMRSSNTRALPTLASGFNESQQAIMTTLFLMDAKGDLPHSVAILAGACA